MTNSIGHRVIAISRIFLKDQWKFLPWWLLSKSEYNVHFSNAKTSSFKITVVIAFVAVHHKLGKLNILLFRVS